LKDSKKLFKLQGEKMDKHKQKKRFYSIGNQKNVYINVIDRGKNMEGFNKNLPA
jgi:hypothetical protein